MTKGATYANVMVCNTAPMSLAMRRVRTDLCGNMDVRRANVAATRVRYCHSKIAAIELSNLFLLLQQYSKLVYVSFFLV